MDENEKIDLKGIEQNAYRESMRDGLTELLLGALLLLASTLWMEPGVSPAFIALFALFGPKILEALKRRYTYPRIGYVKLKAEDGVKVAKGIFGYMMGVVAAMAVFLALAYWGSWSTDLIYKWTPTFMGAMMLGAMLYTQGKSGDDKYYIYGLLALVTGVAFSLHDFELFEIGFSIYLLLWGGVMLSTGSVTFLRFTRRYPRTTEPETHGSSDGVEGSGSAVEG